MISPNRRQRKLQQSHTPPEHLDRVFAEMARVLRTGGHLLLAFQSGHGTRDVAAAYRRFGHDVQLERYLTTADDVATQLSAIGLSETCRLVRVGQGGERDAQTVLLARAI